MRNENTINVANYGGSIEYAGNAGTDRAPIQIAHDTDKLLVSQEEANEEHEETKRRLLASRKLSLVVDLDQTIIHAAVDPTIGEWQNDPENPNYEAVKDVRTFQLKDDGPSMRGCWYYIKMRPGLEQFLENISEKYELHIYTMGTRQYAEKISEIVDPGQKYFSNRILSRDESGSMTVKTLTRLFPVDDKMVVVIDDRADVWKWWPNLVRVSAFDFFPAIGDINSALLPKRQEILSSPKPEPAREQPIQETNGNEGSPNGTHVLNGDVMETATAQADAAVAQPNPAPSDIDTSFLEMQKTQEETIASQVEEKPLLKLQQKMDEKDGAEMSHDADLATQGTESDSSDSESGTHSGKAKRHSILRNDDEELIHLERHLRAIHDRFFNEYDGKRAGVKGGRVAALSGKRKAPLPDTSFESAQSNANMVPDTKKIIPAMKERILDGVTIVFSSVIPLGTDIYTADISMWARSFGAQVADKVGRDVTHVIAARPGTAKVKTAVKRGIPVVSTHWLMQSIQRWKKLDVKPFLLPDIGQKGMENAMASEISVQESLEEKLAFAPEYPLSSDEDTAAAETDGEKQPKRKKLRLDHIPDPTLDFDENIDYSPVGDVESPVEFNADEIQDMQDELAEFMGSDFDSDSDVESVRSERSIALRERKGQKRRREDDDDDDGASEREGESGDERNGERPSSKLQKGLGGSALRAVSNAQTTSRLGQERTQEEYDADLAEELERQLEEESGDENEDRGTNGDNTR